MSAAGEFASEDEFLAIEAAVLETARGRKFLAEFARRCRAAETQTLLDAMKRIESAMTLRAPVAAEPGEMGLLTAAIKVTAADIAAIRNHMLDDGGAMPDDPSVFARIAEEARRLATDLMAEAERVPAEGESESSCLSKLAWRLDVLSQRVTKAMALLAHIDSRIAVTAPDEVAGIPELAAKLAPEKLRFFEEDEELFVPDESPPPPPPAAAAEKPAGDIRERVVIIRRTTAPPPMPAIVSDNVA
jgi:hypothetical protein